MDAAPRPLLRQLPANWAAGVVVGLAATAPAVLRLLWQGETGWVGPLAAALFVPALALALGSSSGTPRLFEVAYLVLWYVGPLNGVAPLDFLGASGEGAQLGVPLVFAALAGPLLLLAMVARRGRLRR